MYQRRAYSSPEESFVRFWSSDGVVTATHGPSSLSISGVSPTGRPSARTAGLSLRPFRDAIRRAYRCAIRVACSS